MTEYTDRDLELMERYNLSPKEIDQMSDEELDELVEEEQVNNLEGGV